MTAGPRLHVTGAAGAGVTTLGLALAGRLALPLLDVDDYFWMPTDPPYTIKRDAAVRLALLSAALAPAHGWVLSGSLDGWGDALAADATFIVFVDTPTDIRLERLRRRQADRFGARILPGGDMACQHAEFLDFAARYETSNELSRSRAGHEKWLAETSRPVLRLDGAAATEDQLARVLAISRGFASGPVHPPWR